jgi:threonine aldolase
MVGRLGDDHRRARELAIGLVKMPCVELDIDTVQTNMVRFRVTGKQSAHEVMARMRERGVLFNAEGAGIRLVTHNDIDDEGVATALAAFADVLAGA